MSNSSLSSLSESDQSELPEVQALVSSIICKLSLQIQHTDSDRDMTVKGKVKKDRSSKERKEKHEHSRHYTYDRGSSSEVLDPRTFHHDTTNDTACSASSSISVDPTNPSTVHFPFSQDLVPVPTGLGTKRVREPCLESPPWKGKKMCDASELKSLGNNSDDECQSQSNEDIEKSVCHLEKLLLEKWGWKIYRVKSDGACLFRSVSHQIFGDEEHHRTIRQHVMDYMQKNRDHFSQFISEDFDRYIARKRDDRCFGNHVEIQAISELYNRPLEIYRDSTVPMNVHHEGYKETPIRLSYHSELHYNSIVDPCSPAVGQGLGMPKGIQPPLPEKDLVETAVKASDEQYTEELLLRKVLKDTDVEDLDDVIAQQTLEDSYAEYLRQQRNHQHVPSSGTSQGPSTSRRGPLLQGLATSSSSSSSSSSFCRASSSGSQPEHITIPSSHNLLPSSTSSSTASLPDGPGLSTGTSTTGTLSVTYATSEEERANSPNLKNVPKPPENPSDDALLRFMPVELFDMDEEDVLAFALAQSRHDYLVSLQQRQSDVAHSHSPPGSSSQQQPSTSK